MATSEVLTVERDGHVGFLWLDHPERRNAMGPAFWADLPVMIGELAGDDEVRAIVLAARGPDFTVGLDLRAMAPVLTGGPEPPAPASHAAASARVLADVRRLQAAFGTVADCPKPIIAAVHGWCIGGGMDLICGCDVRLASADARFSVRETRLAIVADLGTLQRLPAIVGSGHAAELALTGKDIDASRALRIGLVNDVLDDQPSMLAAARELASAIAANPPLAVRGTKAMLRAVTRRTVEEGLDYVGLWNAAFLHSDDLTEALAAFVERRPPQFRGS